MRTFITLAVSIFSSVVLAQPAGISDERQRELVHLVRQDCGSCHGMTLQGGLGPALKPEALRDKPLESLVATIIGGRPGTPMPPWQQFLTEAEAQWIVEKLLDGFPN
jgi:cytochrome c55X